MRQLIIFIAIMMSALLQSCRIKIREDPGQLSFITSDGDYKLVIEIAESNFETFPFLQGDIIKYNWSPDGKTIAFEDSRKYPDRDISIINVDGTGEKNLTNSPNIYEVQPNWSPDGKKIVYSSFGKEQRDIWVMSSDGTNHKQITKNAGRNYDPEWSADGSYIYFTSSRSGEIGIYRMKPDGSEIIIITSNGSEPSCSPDGKKIAFVRIIDDDVNLSRPDEIHLAQNPEIFVMNADGTEQNRLTFNPDYDITPKWSLDSKQIAFVSIRKENYSCIIMDRASIFGIYTMNANGNEQTMITDICEYGILPNWKP